MPTDDKVAGVDLDQYQKDQDTFEEAVDHVLAADPKKTDEELLAEMEKIDADGSSEDGESTKDSTDKASDDSQAVDPNLFGVSPETDGKKPVVSDEGVTDPDKKLDDTEIDWKVKAESLEDELTKEKQKTSSWNGRITAANKRADDAEAKLEEALAAKPKDADSDDSAKSDVAVLEGFRNDFPEMANVIDILVKKVDGKSDATPVKDTTKTTPIEEEPAGTADTDLQGAQAKIRDAHPDLDEAVNSGVLLTWINKQAEFIRPTLQTIYNSGTPDQVIKMVKEFKTKTGWQSQLATDESSKDISKTDDKLKSMIDVNSQSGGAPTDGPDKNDFNGAAEEAFAEK